MIAAVIFLVHFAAMIYAFSKYKKDGISEGWLAVAFVVIIFSVGWTVSTMVAKLMFPTAIVGRWVSQLQATHIERLFAKELTVDTFSLILLTAGELVFYYFYLRPGNRDSRPDTNTPDH
ncbi:MAG TPA: hypothetical protein VI758_03250 [Bacteroidota bacterium]